MGLPKVLVGGEVHREEEWEGRRQQGEQKGWWLGLGWPLSWLMALGSRTMGEGTEKGKQGPGGQQGPAQTPPKQ